ncbi:MAG: hypothetical protein M3Q45_08110, partial [Chloroflexota bacterium]|nr:hypothetical protein [Chloroflexota bacterium]
LDATVDEGDGSEGRAVFMGSVGKLLPSVYIAGRETHAGSPFAGVNATFLAAAITQQLECNAGLTDTVNGETSPPPVCLKQTDLKTYYDVTTPVAAWSYYNLLTHGLAAGVMLDRLLGEVRAAVHEAILALRARARDYSTASGRPTTTLDVTPLILTFADLTAHAWHHDPTGVETALQAIEHEFAANPAIDLPDYSRRIYDALWRQSGLTGPAVIVGFASVHYPAAYVGEATHAERQLRRVVAKGAASVAHDFATTIKLRTFFPGISDMSFLGGKLSEVDAALVAANTPTRRIGSAAVEPIASLNLPTVNIGPWGRDYHQRNERVYAPYAFAVVPELIWRVVNAL